MESLGRDVANCLITRLCPVQNRSRACVAQTLYYRSMSSSYSISVCLVTCKIKNAGSWDGSLLSTMLPITIDLSFGLSDF